MSGIEAEAFVETGHRVNRTHPSGRQSTSIVCSWTFLYSWATQLPRLGRASPGFYVQEAKGQQNRKKHKCAEGARGTRGNSRGVRAGASGEGRLKTFKDRHEAILFQWCSLLDARRATAGEPGSVSSNTGGLSSNTRDTSNPERGLSSFPTQLRLMWGLSSEPAAEECRACLNRTHRNPHLRVPFTLVFTQTCIQPQPWSRHLDPNLRAAPGGRWWMTATAQLVPGLNRWLIWAWKQKTHMRMATLSVKSFCLNSLIISKNP